MSRIVPWTCRSEWVTTYENLYSFQDTQLQLQGILRVEAWKSRSGNKLPLAIEVTANLIAAGVSDVDQSDHSPCMVRLTMAMAIVRFVNGMVDMQQKGVYARSVQSIADEIGLPDWLVDLRHEATHADLPSLEVLRAGCKFSLEWLQDCYWQPQMVELKERDEKLAFLLQKYCESNENKQKYDHKKGKKSPKNAKNPKDIQEIVTLVHDYNMWKAFIKLLACDHSFLLRSFEALQGEKDILWNAPVFQTATSSLELPHEMKELWSPLFKALSKANDGFPEQLLVCLIKEAHDVECSSGNLSIVYYISCWVNFLIDCCIPMNKLIVDWKINFPHVLELCLQFRSSYISSFLPLLIENLSSASDCLKEKLCKFSAIKVFPQDNVNLNIKLSNCENLMNDQLFQEFPLIAQRVKSRKEHLEHPSSSVWQQCDQLYFKDTTFGSLIGCGPTQFEELKQDILAPNKTSLVQEEPTAGEQVFCRRDEHKTRVHTLYSDEDSKSDMFESILPSKEILSYPSTSTTRVELSRKTIHEISQNIWIF